MSNYKTEEVLNEDPITPEEEMDILESDRDIEEGRIVKFSAKDSKEEILKHLGLLWARMLSFLVQETL